MSEFEAGKIVDLNRAISYLKVLHGRELIPKDREGVFLWGSDEVVLGLANEMFEKHGRLDFPVGVPSSERPRVVGLYEMEPESIKLTAPCSPGCRGHVTYPCEKCGRQWSPSGQVVGVSELQVVEEVGKMMGVDVAEPCPLPRVSGLNPSPSIANYPLFEHMQKEHGLTLTGSELNEIVVVVKGMEPKEPVDTRDFVTRQEMLLEIKTECSQSANSVEKALLRRLEDSFREFLRGLGG